MREKPSKFKCSFCHHLFEKQHLQEMKTWWEKLLVLLVAIRKRRILDSTAAAKEFHVKKQAFFVCKCHQPEISYWLLGILKIKHPDELKEEFVSAVALKGILEDGRHILKRGGVPGVKPKKWEADNCLRNCDQFVSGHWRELLAKYNIPPTLDERRRGGPMHMEDSEDVPQLPASIIGLRTSSTHSDVYHDAEGSIGGDSLQGRGLPIDADEFETPMFHTPEITEETESKSKAPKEKLCQICQQRSEDVLELAAVWSRLTLLYFCGTSNIITRAKAHELFQLRRTATCRSHILEIKPRILAQLDVGHTNLITQAEPVVVRRMKERVIAFMETSLDTSVEALLASCARLVGFVTTSEDVSPQRRVSAPKTPRSKNPEEPRTQTKQIIKSCLLCHDRRPRNEMREVKGWGRKALTLLSRIEMRSIDFPRAQALMRQTTIHYCHKHEPEAAAHFISTIHITKLSELDQVHNEIFRNFLLSLKQIDPGREPEITVEEVRAQFFQLFKKFSTLPE